MVRLSCLAALVCGLHGGVAAQVFTQVFSEGPMTAVVRVGTVVETDSLPPLTFFYAPVQAPTTVQATVNSAPPAYHNAQHEVGVLGSIYEQGCVVRSQASIGAGAPEPSAAAELLELRMRITLAQVRLRVRMEGTILLGGLPGDVTALGEVDVFGDGTIDYAITPSTSSIPLTTAIVDLPTSSTPRTVDVVIRSAAMAIGPGAATTNLRVRVEPADVAVAGLPLERGCLAALFAPVPTFGGGVDIYLNRNLVLGDIVVVVLGLDLDRQALPFQLPELTCDLLPRPDIVVQPITDPVTQIRSIRVSRPPSGVGTGLTFYAQGLIMETSLARVYASNTWRVDLQP